MPVAPTGAGQFLTQHNVYSLLTFDLFILAAPVLGCSLSAFVLPVVQGSKTHRIV